MQIKNIEGLTASDINRELERGGKFVIYQYCVSIVVLTFKRSSNIYFLRTGESGFSKSIIFTLISLIFGWWGIPWGPIYTIGSLITNLGGGKNITKEVIASLNAIPVENQ